MLEKKHNTLDQIKNGGEAEADKRNDTIILNIINKGKIIAYLTTEDNGKMFALTYTDEFLKSGVPPFHVKPSEKHKVEIGKTYRSPVLWYAFAARVPNSSRPDFAKALKREGLTGNESVLELIGKMSQVSISRSWSLEIDEAA